MTQKKKALRLVTVFLVCCIVAVARKPLHAYTYTYCTAANPYDSSPDDAALQTCLDNYDKVYLEPSGGSGYVGYIISDTLIIRNNSREFAPSIDTANGELPKPILIAAEDLFEQMIFADNDTNGWELHQIIIDGNRYNRTYKDSCDSIYARDKGINAVLKGYGFTVVGVESVRAMCASGMEIWGQNFEIYNSTFYDNGMEIGTEASGTSPWADGLTVGRCDGGDVHDNYFYDNTDVDLVVFNAPLCRFARNHVSHTFKLGVAGIGIAGGDGDSDGMDAYDNDVYADYGLLRFGITLGNHAWNGGSYTASGVGYVYDNYSEGAVINLLIDGISDGNVYDNTFYNAQGSLSCSSATNYSAGHFGSATIQPYYTSQTVDGGCY